MRWFKFAAVLPALLCVPSAASGETRLAQYPVQFIVIEPRPASTVQLRPGDILLELPLRWQRGASFDREVQIQAGEQATLVKPDDVLPWTRLTFDSAEFSNAVSFCTPRDNNVMASNLSGALFGSLGLKLIKSGNDTQYCLVDKDADGKADHSVMINDGSPAARMPVPINLVGYRVKDAPEVGDGNQLSIIYKGKYTFELVIVMDDQPFVFSELTTASDNKPISAARFLKGEKQADLSRRYVALGVPFRATYDTTSKSIRVELSALDQSIVAPIPDTVRHRYRYY